MGTINELGEKVNAPVLPADATSLEDLENLIDKAMETFWRQIRFCTSFHGMSVNVRKGKHYTR